MSLGAADTSVRATKAIEVLSLGAMELRYAIRILFRSPGFFAIAVLILALGIGINTIVFTLYSTVALKPIAARAPSELVRINGSQNGQRLDQFSYAQYIHCLSGTSSFQDVIATSDPQTTVGRLPGQGEEGEVLRSRLVSTNYFSALGVTPRLGRGFLPEDREAAVVSFDFWTKKLAADGEVLGKTIAVQGASLHIVGVAPERFGGTGLPPQMPDLWVPLAAQPAVLPGVDWIHDDSAKQWQLLGRRRAGVRTAQASAELE